MPCNEMAREIWGWCIERQIWLTATHIPGKENTVADKASRVFNDRTEWQLNQNLFKQITKVYGHPEIDMFAFRINFQMKPYMSWGPDPHAVAVNAFTLDWGKYFLYAFPPFSVISQVLQKVEQDQAETILVVPQWPTQAWYPKLLKLLIANPILVPPDNNNLRLPFNPDKLHPLGGQLSLMACRLSGRPSKVKEFHLQLKKLPSTLGGQAPKNNTRSTWKNGRDLQINGLQIPFNHL